MGAQRQQGQFVCQPLTPLRCSGDTASMRRGEPGIPERFTWAGKEYALAGVAEAWKTSGPCRNGSGERYMRRHWYRVVTDPPMELVIYCDRQSRTRGKPARRWWVYTAKEL